MAMTPELILDCLSEAHPYIRLPNKSAETFGIWINQFARVLYTFLLQETFYSVCVSHRINVFCPTGKGLAQSKFAGIGIFK